MRGGPSEISMSCCTCKLVETAQSLGDDTHAGGYTARVGMRARAAHTKWAVHLCRWAASLVHR